MRVFTFSKSDRLLKRSEFLKLSRLGKKKYNKHFIIYYLEQDLTKTRIGITASKKVGGSVTRNRLKRLVREYYRSHKHILPGNLDINIILKKEASDLNTESFFYSLSKLFNKIERKREENC